MSGGDKLGVVGGGGGEYTGAAAGAVLGFGADFFLAVGFAIGFAAFRAFGFALATAFFGLAVFRFAAALTFVPPFFAGAFLAFFFFTGIVDSSCVSRGRTSPWNC